MRQKNITKWISGTLVAGMLAASVLTGQTESVQAYQNMPVMPVKKSGFQLTEHVTEGVEALSPETGGGSAVTPPAGMNDQKGNTVVAGTSQNNQSKQGQSSQGTTNDGSKTVTAGGGKGSKTGPTINATIVTEGEKGFPATEPILGGASITMINSRTNSQILSMIVETSQGNLIVVDGGLGEDGDYLLSQIQARGGHVSAWLLTHPHGDHVGAIYKILQDGAQGIQIDGIYYAMGNAEWYNMHDPDEKTMAISLLGTFEGLPQNILHQVSRNQFIQVDDVIIQVMNDRYELSDDTGNNAGIVYKMLINNKKVLFLGDLGEAGGKRLLADVGAEQLQADIVQMAHHGQNGVGEEVYRAINPSICLWPTPQWMWEHDGSKWKILDTKSWVSKLGDLKHYVMKDGDQTIY